MFHLKKIFSLILILVLFTILSVILYLRIAHNDSNDIAPLDVESSVVNDNCSHVWDRGICHNCGKTCSHEWENGNCTNCGIDCKHEYNDIHICNVCGTICSHPSFSDNFSCTDCGYVCLHTYHDQQTAVCTVCGAQTRHIFSEMVCSCGKTLSLTDSSIPDELLAAVPEHGTVELLKYSTHNYIFEKKNDVIAEGEKQLAVYLPFGYTDEKQYNVLVLVHGGGGDEYDWLCNRHLYYGEELQISEIIDAMIYYGYCEPLIIVAASSSTLSDVDDKAGITVWVQLYPEYRNDILPFIADNFSTYAESSDEADISAARDHFAIAGLSDGALVAQYAGMLNAMDMFSWFGCYSANAGMEKILSAMEDKWKNYSINYFYTSAGEHDFQKTNVQQQYAIFINSTDKVIDGVNSSITIMPELEHEWTTWILSLYNSLLIFFNN